jgi:hypothetical protein
MRKSIFFILALILIVLPVSADNVYSYSGATAQYATASAGFELSINSDTWLKKSASSSDSSFVYYGFYLENVSENETGEGKMILDASTPTLVFKEEIASLKDDTYKGVASFKVYFYIISNSKFNATLTWSDLTPTSRGSAKTLTVSMNGDSSKSLSLKNGSRDYLFDPADGIYQKINMSFEAVTQTYNLPTKQRTYTGWLKLTLETKS